jgi:hypothetical protein
VVASWVAVGVLAFQLIDVPDRSASAQQLPSPVFDTVGVDEVEDF